MSIPDVDTPDVAEYPRTKYGLAVAVVVTLGLLVGIRFAVGLLVGDVVQPVTYVAVLGGILGAAAMVQAQRQLGMGQYPPTIGLWMTVAADTDDSPAAYAEQATYLHLTYGALAAGIYPRLFHDLGLSGGTFAALPWAFLVGALFGLLLFLPALGYVAAGLVDVPLEFRPIRVFLGLHVVYGLVLGLVVGSWGSLVAPMLL